MKVYHISRTEGLYEGMLIDIDGGFKPNNEMGDALIAGFNLRGVSEHGKSYLHDRVYFSNEPASLDDVRKSNSTCSMMITEYTFEIIRQLKFPHMPSRLVSFFAIESLTDTKYWPELISNEYSVFEIDIDYTPVKLDASYLISGLGYGQDTPFKFHQGFSPSFNYYHAINYWSGQFSDNPKPELLLSLPLTIGKKLNR